MQLDELTDEIEWRLAELTREGAIGVGADGSVTVCETLPCPTSSILVIEAGSGLTRNDLQERLRRKVRSGLLTLR